MALTKIKIAVGVKGAYRPIDWRGHIVPGTKDTLAITRPATFNPSIQDFEPATSGWNITHLPTGFKVPRVQGAKLQEMLPSARKLYRILAKRILAKRKVAESTDTLKIRKKASRDFRRAFPQADA